MLTPTEAKHIIEIRAKQRGFSSYDEVLATLDTPDQTALYLVMKEYSLIELFNGINNILQSDNPLREDWYKRSWTKTIILAGNPYKLRSHFNFDYVSPSIAILGPHKQEDTVVKNLVMNYVFPLITQPLDISKFTTGDHKPYTIFFQPIKMSLPKFVVQLAHIFAEVGIENGIQKDIPSILISDQGISEKEFQYIYHRIDGGLTELKPLTHTATAAIKL